VIDVRILVVEDEYKIADIISSRLKEEKYTVDTSLDGEEGLYNALTGIYDLILLDVMLPKVDGFEILKKIKEEQISSKVIMLTAKGMLEDKLHGFDIGVDDYITKPFHIEELVARVNVQLRKQDIVNNKDILEYGDLKLNIRTTKLTCKSTNETIDIICKEFLILEYLMKNSGQVISKATLYDKVWGLDSEIESNNLEAYISFIRKKLKAISSKTTIKAIRGLGYKLEVSNE
jgi:two component transcriptional regulator, winged helix family